MIWSFDAGKSVSGQGEKLECLTRLKSTNTGFPNQFASDFLIPAKYDARIASLRSRAEVVQLADELGIAPGVVVGRFQYLTGKWNYFKDLILVEPRYVLGELYGL